MSLSFPVLILLFILALCVLVLYYLALVCEANITTGYGAGYVYPLFSPFHTNCGFGLGSSESTLGVRGAGSEGRLTGHSEQRSGPSFRRSKPLRRFPAL